MVTEVSCGKVLEHRGILAVHSPDFHSKGSRVRIPAWCVCPKAGQLEITFGIMGNFEHMKTNV